MTAEHGQQSVGDRAAGDHFGVWATNVPEWLTGKVQKFRIREQALLDLKLEAVARTETA